MSATKVFAFAVGILFVYSAFGQLPKARFEYKYSFKGPHLVQRDNSIPFWEYSGDALAGEDGIRLTPSLRSKKGSVWSKNALTAPHWMMDVAVRVNGRGRIGADGMAIWFTEQKGSEGSVFGSNDMWKGLGIFLDSFDNDNQHNNPYIMAVVNDGNMQFDHNNDGGSQQLGGCLRDFRNKPFPVRLNIEYYKQALTVKVNNGLSNKPEDYELCLRAVNVHLPQTAYLGMSAATGGLADDHDVNSFLVHTLHEPGTETAKVSEEERRKFEEEFNQYYKDLERAKEDYQKEHPNKADPYNIPEDSLYESESQRELRQIFDGQMSIQSTVREVSRKLDELLGRQELVLSKISTMPGGSGQVPQQVPQMQQQQGGQVYVDTIKRHEVDRVLNNQNDLLQQIRDLRMVVNNVAQRSAQAPATVPQGGGGGGGGFGDQMALHEIRDRLNTVSNDVSLLVKRPMPAMNTAQCPPPPSGSFVSPVIFFLAMGAQVIIIIGYMVYRQNKEASAKKFY